MNHERAFVAQGGIPTIEEGAPGLGGVELDRSLRGRGRPPGLWGRRRLHGPRGGRVPTERGHAPEAPPCPTLSRLCMRVVDLDPSPLPPGRVGGGRRPPADSLRGDPTARWGGGILPPPKTSGTPRCVAEAFGVVPRERHLPLLGQLPRVQMRLPRRRPRGAASGDRGGNLPPSPLPQWPRRTEYQKEWRGGGVGAVETKQLNWFPGPLASFPLCWNKAVESTGGGRVFR